MHFLDTFTGYVACFLGLLSLLHRTRGAGLTNCSCCHSEGTGAVPLMVDSCVRRWVGRCPHTCSNALLGASVSVFGDGTYIYTVGLGAEQIAPLHVGGPPTISRGPGENKEPSCRQENILSRRPCLQTSSAKLGLPGCAAHSSPSEWEHQLCGSPVWC